MKNLYLLLAILLSFQPLYAQNLELSTSDLLSWAPSPTNAANISQVPIADRVITGKQLAANLDANAKVLYSPDGMNNFGPYVDSSSVFNHFNFSHWQYIDLLAWFGGTADIPILLPSKPWMDAAHSNGVKVVGCLFFAPTAWGGSESRMTDFLVKDLAGDFIAVKKMTEMADYYNFDGWFLNFETSVSASTGALASEFVAALKAASGKEIIWYDAMLPSGTVSWQNELNNNNSYFFENSTGMFTNYWWGLNQVLTSQNTANNVGRSPFDVYKGADMWPDRNNQPAFSDFGWIDIIFPNGVARTSVALYATNFTFNHAGNSVFNNDPNDVQNFLAAERKIFSGVDQNPFVVDNQWKGMANYVPVRTTIMDLPFETSFNLGHGHNFYHNGVVLRAGDWHNMSHQSPPVSWTFYSDNIAAAYDYDTAFDGGSSLALSGTGAGLHTIPLYSTYFSTPTGIGMEMAIKTSSSSITEIGVELVFEDQSTKTLSFIPTASGNWEAQSKSSTASSIPVIAVNLMIQSTGNFDVNVGKITLSEDMDVLTEEIASTPSITAFPNPSNEMVNFTYPYASPGLLCIFDLNGKLLLQKKISEGGLSDVRLASGGVYLYEISNENGLLASGRLIVK